MKTLEGHGKTMDRVGNLMIHNETLQREVERLLEVNDALRKDPMKLLTKIALDGVFGPSKG